MRQILDKFTATLWHHGLAAWLPAFQPGQADPLVSLFCNGAFERFQHIINRLGRLVAFLATHGRRVKWRRHRYRHRRRPSGSLAEGSLAPNDIRDEGNLWGRLRNKDAYVTLSADQLNLPSLRFSLSLSLCFCLFNLLSTRCRQ